MVFNCNTSYPIVSEYNKYFERYPFGLSSFQKHAIEGIVKKQHVLITAHTGSGKTLPAEFAIEHLVASGKKVIYTSPIKALSNQKFYEFREKFPNISFGLITGDIKTNPEADVLIVTTEILMNRLFHSVVVEKSLLQFNMDFEKDLAAVVFDEIHYINDADRGKVWEKTILMLPAHVQMVMLSATLDNPERFANWIEKIHNKDVCLCPTSTRVVPLIHYGFMVMGEHDFKKIKDKSLLARMRKMSNKPILLKDGKGKFIPEGYKELKELIKEGNQLNTRIERKFCLNQLAKYLKENDMLPAIGFVFSRKHVELCAKSLTTNLLEDDSLIPYTIKREAEQIIRRLPNHEEYTGLPEYLQLISLLEKGIGIHHSGMIPVLREIVELFISKKYIKLLFATESFAIGLDCPIKTVIFTGLVKFDGNHERYLLPHEYTQMAGRAGRRGIDTVGNIIHCNNLFRNLPTETEYRGMMEGKPQILVSKFKIDYGLIMNVLANNGDDVVTTVDSIVAFVEKSMMCDELHSEIKRQEKEVQVSYKTLENMLELVSINKIPVHILEEYKSLTSAIKTCQMKKMKKYQKEIDDIKEMHGKTIDNEVDRVEKLENQKWIVQKEEGVLENVRQFIPRQIMSICRLLESQGFLSIHNDSEILIFEHGRISCHLAEIPGHIWVPLIVGEWDYFREFTPRQIVGLLSCLTDAKIKEEYDTEVIRSKDAFMSQRVDELRKRYILFDEEESNRDIQTGVNLCNIHMMDLAMEWCDCVSEEACKIFIQTKIDEVGISLGDFTKSVLKIATAAKELRGLYELSCCCTQTEYFHKLATIEELVLKYVATNQSLYV